MAEHRVAFSATKNVEWLDIFEVAASRGAQGTTWRYIELADRPTGTSVFIFQNESDATIVRDRATAHPRIELVN